MNRRGFLKMLGIAVPAAVIAPLAVAESTPQVGYGRSCSRIDLLEMDKWHRVGFDMDPLLWGPVRGPALVKASAMVHRIDEKTNTVFLIPVEGR